MIDDLQQVRMLAIWPIVVGSAAFFLARLTLLLVSPVGKVGRTGAIIAGGIGVVAGVVAMSISRSWDNSYSYWLSFTVGLAGLALILAMTAAMLAAEDASHDD